jgi:hypothetical protein
MLTLLEARNRFLLHHNLNKKNRNIRLTPFSREIKSQLRSFRKPKMNYKEKTKNKKHLMQYKT